MDTLNYIIKRYDLKLEETPSPVKILESRWYGMGPLFKDLGFKKGVEVGVYKGQFSAALCKGCPELELIGVDAWTVYGNYRDYETTDLESEAYKEALARTAGCNVRFIKALSMDAVKEFADESLDFVFIDANHDYEYVVEDIAAWSKKVHPGGLVIGHDYCRNTEFNFGVIEAVDGWCRTHNISPLFIWKDQCPSWMYVKK